MASRSTPRAKALSRKRLRTDLTLTPARSFSGRTSAAAVMRPLSWSAAEGRCRRATRPPPSGGIVRHHGVSDVVGRAQLPQRLRGHDALPRENVAGLFAVEVVRQAGEPPEVGVLTEPHRQRPHDRLRGQHVAAQVLVGHARLHDRQDLFARRPVHRPCSPCLDLVDDGAAQALLLVRGTCDLAARRDDGDLVLVGADADALGEDVVEHQEVDALGRLLARARSSCGPASAAKPTRNRPGRASPPGCRPCHELERELWGRRGRSCPPRPPRAGSRRPRRP